MVFPVAEDLDVGVQGLDRILALSQLSVQGITVSFGIHGVESLHSSRLVLDADLDLLQSDLGLLDLAVDLLCQPLESVGTGVNNMKVRENRIKKNSYYLHKSPPITLHTKPQFLSPSAYPDKESCKASSLSWKSDMSLFHSASTLL